MEKNIAVITIHGMGDTNPYYYKDLEKKLMQYVGLENWNKEVHFENIYFQDLLQGNQEAYWNKIDKKHSLKWDFFRKFMLYSFSDAASIEHSLRNDMKLYLGVHKKIADAFDNSFQALGNKQKPVVIIAHSLGCEQISNYLWDAGKGRRFFSNDSGATGEKKFRRLKSCKMFVTTGCNIPIFRSGLVYPKIFKKPNKNFRWVNYFDPHDVLGYPIRDMSKYFEVDWIEDTKVSVGGLLTSWNPACHEKYWTDRDVLKPIANEILSIIGV